MKSCFVTVRHKNSGTLRKYIMLCNFDPYNHFILDFISCSKHVFLFQINFQSRVLVLSKKSALVFKK